MMFTPARILSVVAGLVLLAVPAASTAIPKSAPGDIEARDTYVGPVNVQLACITQYNSNFMEARHDGNGANDWYCYDTSTGTNRGGVNMDAACLQDYGSNTYADHSGGGANDWGCYRR